MFNCNSKFITSTIMTELCIVQQLASARSVYEFPQMFQSRKYYPEGAGVLPCMRVPGAHCSREYHVLLSYNDQTMKDQYT